MLISFLLTIPPHPSTLNPTPLTLDPKPSTLNPNPLTLVGKNMRHLKMKCDGPNYGGGGMWFMAYSFEMMLMKIKVREEFIMDEEGKIKELTRIRM